MAGSVAVSARLFRFGDYTLDPGTRELRRRDVLITLSPKVFDCIAYLIEHRDRAVGRDELVAAVWGKADVADPLLGQILVKARRVIGDSGDGQRAIRTVPRFGYHWVAPTEVIADPHESVGSAAPRTLAREAIAPVAPALPGRRNAARAVILLGAIAALLGVLAWQPFRDVARTDPPAPALAAPQADIAVLPVDVVADTDAAWLRLGLMDFISQRLHAAGLTAVPSDTMVALMASGRHGPEVAAAHVASGAQQLVVPSVRQLVDGWQVSLRLRERDGAQRVAEAHGADVMAVATQASDRLLAILGRAAPTDPDRLSADEWHSRVQAAMLIADFDRARALLDAAPEAVKASVELRLQRAEVEERSGRFDAARELLDDLLDALDAETSPVARARVQNGLGRVAVRLEQPDLAERHFSDAIALLQGHDETAESARALAGRGVAFALLGQLGRASGDFASARIAFATVGDSLALARIESNEAMLEIRRNHHAAALPMLERALRHFERLGLPNEWPIALGAQVSARLALLQPAQALAGADAAENAIAFAEPPARRYFEYQRARALMANGRLGAARVLLGRLIAGSSPRTEPGFWGQLHAASAQLDLATGRTDSALATARIALADLGGPDYVRERGDAWLVALRALRALGCTAEARTAAKDFSAAANLADDATLGLRARMAMAEQAWTDGQRDAALQLLQRSFHAAVQDGAPVDVVELAASWGGLLIEDGDLGSAAAVLGQIARWAERDFDSALLQARLYRALDQPAAARDALAQARALAGERTIPAFLLAPASADSDAALARGERSDSGTHAACSRPPARGSIQ